MDFNETIASGVLVVRNCVRLATSPYETMRQLSRKSAKSEWGEIVWILSFVAMYFVWAAYVRFGFGHGVVPILAAARSFGFFCITSALFIGMLYILGKSLERFQKVRLKSVTTLMYVNAYALLPTYLWFVVTSVLYVLFPPPRFFSSLGVTFSFMFVVFSLSMFMWRLSLAYLTIRFAFQAKFVTVLGIMLACGCVLVPYVIAAYKMGLVRVPFF